MQTIPRSVATTLLPFAADVGAIGTFAMAFRDLFRLEDSLIVEHWDLIAPIPGPEAQHNEAGKF